MINQKTSVAASARESICNVAYVNLSLDDLIGWIPVMRRHVYAGKMQDSLSLHERAQAYAEFNLIAVHDLYYNYVSTH